MGWRSKEHRRPISSNRCRLRVNLSLEGENPHESANNLSLLSLLVRTDASTDVRYESCRLRR
jgi:hypothetical protein